MRHLDAAACPARFPHGFQDLQSPQAVFAVRIGRGRILRGRLPLQRLHEMGGRIAAVRQIFHQGPGPALAASVELPLLDAEALLRAIDRDLVLVRVAFLDAEYPHGHAPFQLQADVGQGLVPVVAVLDLALHPGHPPAGQPGTQVRQVHGPAQEHAAHFPGVEPGVVALDCGDHLQLTDLPGGELLPHVFGAGHEVPRERGHQHQILLPAEAHQLFGLCRIHGQGFVDQHGNAALQGQPARLEVVQVRGAHDHAVHPIRLQQLAIVREFHTVAQSLVPGRQPLGGDIADRGNLHVGPAEKIADVVPGAEASESDDADTHFFHHVDLQVVVAMSRRNFIADGLLPRSPSTRGRCPHRAPGSRASARIHS